MNTYEDPANNVKIEAGILNIGSNVTFGRDVNIRVRKELKIGSNSHIGDRFTASCESLHIGEYFYNQPTDSRGLVIGGGGSHFPFAHVRVGDRCVCHTGHWNCARAISIGDDVGLSHDVDLLTHGFWGSVLEGYPASFRPIYIGNNVILGWKSVVMPGVRIGNDVVLAANSTVVRNLMEAGIYAGSPAEWKKAIIPLSEDGKDEKIREIMSTFIDLMSHYHTRQLVINWEKPHLQINQLLINVDTRQCVGEHDEVSDAFRDHLRRYGIRIFHPRGFKFALERI